jgi:hypothetical protein
MLLVLVGGFAIYRLSSKEVTPSREFAELELAGADAHHTGSCYSLSTVLVANGIFGRAPRTWTAAGKNSWTLGLETVTQGYNGPLHEFVNFTFEQRDQQIRLASVDASKGRPTAVDRNIDMLLAAPNDRNSTPVARCLEPGASGYLYKSKR